MKRSRTTVQGPWLFDLPVRDPDSQADLPSSEAPTNEVSAAEAANEEPQFQEHDSDELEAAQSLDREESASVVARTPPSVVQRLASGLADLVVHAGVLAGALAGMKLMGVDPDLAQWPGLLGLLTVFSFLYTVIPLAFWGQTPGMAWSGLLARDSEDRPLTFGQTAMRWIGSCLTAALLGLPLLVALSGRSLSDHMSRSWTYREVR